MSSRLRAVHIFTLTYEQLMFWVRRPSPARPPRTCHRALACAARSFLNKTVLSPRHRAHYAHSVLEPTAMSCNDIVDTPFKGFLVLERMTWPVIDPNDYKSEVLGA